MKRKIAVPVDSNGILDGHFGHCKYFAVFNTSGNTILSEELFDPPIHEPGVLPKWLSEKGVTDIIAGGMGQMAIRIFNRNGVNAFVGAPRINAWELATKYLKDELNLSENYCNH